MKKGVILLRGIETKYFIMDAIDFVIYGFLTKKDALSFYKEHHKEICEKVGKELEEKIGGEITIEDVDTLESVSLSVMWDQVNGNGAYHPEWYSKEDILA